MSHPSDRANVACCGTRTTPTGRVRAPPRQQSRRTSLTHVSPPYFVGAAFLIRPGKEHQAVNVEIPLHVRAAARLGAGVPYALKVLSGQLADESAAAACPRRRSHGPSLLSHRVILAAPVARFPGVRERCRQGACTGESDRPMDTVLRCPTQQKPSASAMPRSSAATFGSSRRKRSPSSRSSSPKTSSFTARAFTARGGTIPRERC